MTIRRWLSRAPAPEPPPSPTPAGSAAPQLAHPANHDRHAYPTLRILVAALFLSFALNIALAGVLIWLIPLRTVVPYILQVHPHGRQVIDLQPLHGAAVPRAKVIVEGVVGRYVEEWHTVFEWPDEMHRRWMHEKSYLASHTEHTLYQEFKKAHTLELENIRRTPYRREVEIVDMRRLSHDDWRYEVDIDLIDSRGSIQQSTVNRSHWTVTLEVRRLVYDEDGPTIEQARRNPFGLYVTRYVLRDRPPPPQS